MGEDGFEPSKRNAADFTSADNALKDSVLLGGVKIVKKDAYMGDSTDDTALFDGITFAVINNSTAPVVVNGTTYAVGDTVLTLAIKWDGTEWSAESGNVLPYGDYSVKENASADYEDRANDYYKLNTESFTINVRESNKTLDIACTNELIPAKITVNKTDLNGKVLAGAKFLLEWSEDGENWNPVVFSESEYVGKGNCWSENLVDGELVTGEDGIIEFTGLHPALTYRLSETEAPNGYLLLTDYAFEGEAPKKDFEVNKTVRNSPAFEIPKTGAEDFALLPIAVAMLLLTGMSLVYYISKQKRGEI